MDRPIRGRTHSYINHEAITKKNLFIKNNYIDSTINSIQTKLLYIKLYAKVVLQKLSVAEK